MSRHHASPVTRVEAAVIDRPITHTAALPFGYRATFQWSQAAGFKVLWEPDVPRIKAPRAQRKFRDAYNAARY